MLEQHLGLYRAKVERLNAIRTSYPLLDWSQQTGVVNGAQLDPARGILIQPVAQLDLGSGFGQIKSALALVAKEFSKYEIPFVPNWHFGTEDFWTTDKGISVNIPWYLGTNELWRLAARTQATAYTYDQVLRCLRHELGHAVFFAYNLGDHPLWTSVFGDCRIPYPECDEALTPDVRSQSYVEYLTNAPAHYAQKHPEEAWAEAFGRLLDSMSAADWQSEYAPWPEAQTKLSAVEVILEQLRGAKPVNTYKGRVDPYTTLRGTVADRLGVPRAVLPFSKMGWSEHSELLRQEPAAHNGVVLHEIYFAQFCAVSNHAQPKMLALADAGWGSWEAFMGDLRAACGTTNGWALLMWDGVRARIDLVEQDHIGVMVGCKVVMAIDCHEHAYAMDYGARKDLYIAAVLEGMDWGVMERRLEDATISPPVVWDVVSLEALAPDSDGLDDAPDNGERRAAHGGGNKVAVVRQVMGKNGVAFNRTYWVNPAQVKEGDKVIPKGEQPPLDNAQKGKAEYKVKQLLLAGQGVPQHLIDAVGVKNFDALKIMHEPAAGESPKLTIPQLAKLKYAVTKQLEAGKEPTKGQLDKLDPKILAELKASVAKAKTETQPEEAVKAAAVVADAKVAASEVQAAAAHAALDAKIGVGEDQTAALKMFSQGFTAKYCQEYLEKMHLKKQGVDAATATPAQLLAAKAHGFLKFNFMHATAAVPNTVEDVRTEIEKWSNYWTKDFMNYQGSDTSSSKAQQSMNTVLGYIKTKMKGQAFPGQATGLDGTPIFPPDKPALPFVAGAKPETLEGAKKAWDSVKNKSAGDILKTFGASHEGAQAALTAMNSWIGSSTGNEAIMMRQTVARFVAERTGVSVEKFYANEKAAIGTTSKNKLDVLHTAQLASPPNEEARMDGIKAMMRTSQAIHADQEWLTVYRGVSLSPEKHGKDAITKVLAAGELPTGMLSSFSTDPHKANNFGSHVFQFQVHRSQVLSTHEIGTNELSSVQEREIVAITPGASKFVEYAYTGKGASLPSHWGTKHTKVPEKAKDTPGGNPMVPYEKIAGHGPGTP